MIETVTLEKRRAIALRDQVLRTWSPPLAMRDTDMVSAVQTSTMQALYWCWPDLFDGVALTNEQREALDQGRSLMSRALPHWSETG